MRSSTPQNVSSLEVKTTGITRVASLDGAPKKEEPNKDPHTSPPTTNTSNNLTPFPPTKSKFEGGTKVSSLERIAAQLQANQLLKSQSLEIKSDAVCSTGTTMSTFTASRPSNPPLTCTLTPSSGGSVVVTPTLGQVNLNMTMKGTGTGSVTATPTSYMTAVTTTASTTSASVVGQDLLGKRVRKQSTKYEDFEQPTAMVCVCVCGCIPGDHSKGNSQIGGGGEGVGLFWLIAHIRKCLVL